MSELTPPRDSQEPTEDKSQEHEVSSEAITALHDAISTFLEALPTSETTDDGDGWGSKSYDTVLPDDGYFVRVAGFVIQHEKFGVVQRPMLRIHRGTAKTGVDMESDFGFSIEDVAVWKDEPLTIDDEGRVISGSDERFYFYDSVAIEARAAELLDDITFDGEGESDSVVMPNLEVSPSGEIYEDGIAETTEKKLVGGLGLGMTFKYDSEDERRVFERRVAALEQARKDVGTGLNEERVQRVIDLLARLHS